MPRGKAASRFDIQVVFPSGLKYRRQSIGGHDYTPALIAENLRQVIAFIEAVEAPQAGDAVDPVDGDTIPASVARRPVR